MNKYLSFFGVVLILSLMVYSTSLFGEPKESKKGYLGVSVESLTRHLKNELNADYGVVIASISIDSPADKYGLMEDDVIQRVDDIKIRRPSTLTRIIQKIKPGDEAKIAIVRDGKSKIISVKIGRLKNSSNYIFGTGKNQNLFQFFGNNNAYLGVKLQNLNEDLAKYFNVDPENGVLILEVEEESPAEKAGLKAGDIVTVVDGDEVSEASDVRQIISELEAGDEIELSIIRNRDKKEIKVTLDEQEINRDFQILTSPFHDHNIDFNDIKTKKLLDELNKKEIKKANPKTFRDDKIRKEKLNKSI